MTDERKIIPCSILRCSMSFPTDFVSDKRLPSWTDCITAITTKTANKIRSGLGQICNFLEFFADICGAACFCVL